MLAGIDMIHQAQVLLEDDIGLELLLCSWPSAVSVATGSQVECMHGQLTCADKQAVQPFLGIYSVAMRSPHHINCYEPVDTANCALHQSGSPANMQLTCSVCLDLHICLFVFTVCLPVFDLTSMQRLCRCLPSP